MYAVSDVAAVIIAAIVVLGLIVVALVVINRRGRHVHVTVDIGDNHLEDELE